MSSGRSEEKSWRSCRKREGTRTDTKHGMSLHTAWISKIISMRWRIRRFPAPAELWHSEEWARWPLWIFRINRAESSALWKKMISVQKSMTGLRLTISEILSVWKVRSLEPKPEKSPFRFGIWRCCQSLWYCRTSGTVLRIRISVTDRDIWIWL